MIKPRLTGLRPLATSACMTGSKRNDARSGHGAWCAMAVVLAGASMLAGCISVNAPDEPIVIELNINIKQEVIYRLAADAENTIEENEDIF